MHARPRRERFLSQPASERRLRLSIDRMEHRREQQLGMLCGGLLVLILLLAIQPAGTQDPKSCGLPDCNRLLAQLKGRLSFSPQDILAASQDFGNMAAKTSTKNEGEGFASPVAGVLFPGDASDIVALLRHAFLSRGDILVSARGTGHSIRGQALPAVAAAAAADAAAPAPADQQLNVPAQRPTINRHGIVVEMRGLRGIDIFAGAHGEVAFVDAGAGELWFDVIRRCLAQGLAPRSFTDYLHLTVGGTLSNAGISGQAYRFGPQISNVLQLEVVTGKGEMVTCSPLQNADLFFAVLGGLGQFGIITRARILLEKAPVKVRWIRALYSDFASFSRDQESLINQPKANSFDYVEGFVIVNRGDSTSHGYASVPFRGQSINSSLIPASPVLYCLELVKKHDDSSTAEAFQQTVSSLLAPLKHIPSLLFSSDVPYMDFLNRVHDAESKLREVGLWQTAHPWMNLFIPKSGISHFSEFVFHNLLKDGINGPLIVYPLDRSKWDLRMSAVTPDEDVFYLVGILRYAFPEEKVDKLMAQNQEILSFCREAGINFKQYLPHYTTEAEWKRHFGSRWNTMVRRKSTYDPLALLSTGQRIFTRWNREHKKQQQQQEQISPICNRDCSQ